MHRVRTGNACAASVTVVIFDAALQRMKQALEEAAGTRRRPRFAFLPSSALHLTAPGRLI